MKPNEICKAGQYFGHPDGGYQLTVEDLQRMVDNFNGEIVVDYEHNSHNPMIDKAPAAGWVKSLKVVGDLLIGDIKWTDDASGMIDKEEYKYLSPVIDIYAVDAHSGNPIGCKLISVGLTNIPFMEDLEAVQNKFIHNSDLKNEMQDSLLKGITMKEIQKTLGLPGASEQELVDVITGIKKNKTDLEGQMAKLNADIDATKKADEAKAKEITDLKAKLKTLEDKEAATAGQAEEAEFETVIANSLKSGKLTPAMVDDKSDTGKLNKTAFKAAWKANKAFFDGLPVIGIVSGQPGASGQSEDTSKLPIDVKMNKAIAAEMKKFDKK